MKTCFPAGVQEEKEGEQQQTCKDSEKKKARQLHHCSKKDLRVAMSEAAINSKLMLFQLPQVQRFSGSNWMDWR